jgi:hypothetical protein
MEITDEEWAQATVHVGRALGVVCIGSDFCSSIEDKVEILRRTAGLMAGRRLLVIFSEASTMAFFLSECRRRGFYAARNEDCGVVYLDIGGAKVDAEFALVETLPTTGAYEWDGVLVLQDRDLTRAQFEQHVWPKMAPAVPIVLMCEGDIPEWANLNGVLSERVEISIPQK